MATTTLYSLCFPILLILSSYCLFVSGTWASNEFQNREGRKLLNVERRLDDTTPITNPANFPPFTPTPTIVTVPASNPTTVTPQNPIPTPVTTVPSSTPTNPAAPITNPATTFPPPAVEGGSPVSPSTGPATSGLITPGQTWCIARAGSPADSLQSAIDYACGIGGADCSTIQAGGSCYNPNSLENHASVAFNSYFQKNPVATSCDFGGVAVTVNTNPSTGSCIYPSSATQGANTPSSMNPPATTTSSSGATGSAPGFAGSGGSDSSPPLFNFPGSGSGSGSGSGTGSPAFYGPDSPPTGDSFPAGSTALQPAIGFIILVASFSAGKLILSI